MGVSSPKLSATFDHSIFISLLISLTIFWCFKALISTCNVTSLLVYYELRIICFEMRKFFLSFGDHFSYSPENCFIMNEI